MRQKAKPSNPLARLAVIPKSASLAHLKVGKMTYRTLGREIGCWTKGRWRFHWWRTPRRGNEAVVPVFASKVGTRLINTDGTSVIALERSNPGSSANARPATRSRRYPAL